MFLQTLTDQGTKLALAGSAIMEPKKRIMTYITPTCHLSFEVYPPNSAVGNDSHFSLAGEVSWTPHFISVTASTQI